jgi:hypothetical protein
MFHSVSDRESRTASLQRLRPYSLRLLLISVPISYGAFIFVVWGIGVLTHRPPGDPSIVSSFAVVSVWYALSCYVWIPLTWIASSFTIATFRRRRH